MIFCGLPYGRKLGSQRTLHHVAANHQPPSPRLLKLSQATNRESKTFRNISALGTNLQLVGNLNNPVGKFFRNYLNSDMASDVELNKILMKFQVLATVNMNIATFYVVTLCCFVDRYRFGKPLPPSSRFIVNMLYTPSILYKLPMTFSAEARLEKLKQSFSK
jgi:hypothetical protein